MLWNAKQKRFKRFAQHGGILLSVVAKPSFPKRKGPNAVVGDSGFAIGNDVFDVLTRTQLNAASEELPGWIREVLALGAGFLAL